MDNRQVKKKLAVSIVYIHIFPVILFLSLEILNIVYEKKYSQIVDNIPSLIISSIFIYIIILIFFMLFGNFFISSMITSVILLTFYIVNFYRRFMTGNVIIPSDFNFVRQLNSIISFSTLKFDMRIVYSALCVLIIQIPLFFISRHLRPSFKLRTIGLTVIIGAMIFIFFTPFSHKKILTAFNVDLSAREGINHLYETNGTLMGFYTLCFSEQADIPEDYNKRYMEDIANQVIKNSATYTDSNETTPNVIIIMSEAFFDPEILPSITYTEDPIPNLHKLSENTTSGHIVTPSFGGMTCNPEYELLTGNSMKYSGYGDTPYYSPEEYINKDNGRSLVSMFKKNGYKTIGLHTNTMYFYDRNEHYPKLGFDEFIGAEMMNEIKYKGTIPEQELISDEYFMDTLLNVVDNTEEPLFLFGVTMQNHSPYPSDKYESTNIGVKTSLLKDEDILSLETYLEGVHDIDTQLGRLYEYIMSFDEPTIVAYFGDHLPIITHGTDVYTDLGYIENKELSSLTLDEKYKMYTTPYIVFSNYKNLPETWGDVSTYFFGALIADTAGIEKNPYYEFLLHAYERFHALTEEIYISADGKIHSVPLKKDDDILKMFRLFQYDKLFGQNYVGKIMSDIKIGPVLKF